MLHVFCILYLNMFMFGRDHILPRWISIMSRTPEVQTMYEEKSFMRDKTLLRYVIQLLDSLNDFKINLEKSLIKGVHV